MEYFMSIVSGTHRGTERKRFYQNKFRISRHHGLSSDTVDEILPFWYARVPSIHSVVVTQNDQPEAKRRIDFLRVRWFGRENEFAFGDRTIRN